LAKEVLINNFKSLPDNEYLSKMPRKRDVDSRSMRELDNIFGVHYDMDGAKQLGPLSRFVSDSPDKYLRLMENTGKSAIACIDVGGIIPLNVCSLKAPQIFDSLDLPREEYQYHGH
jgi:hypothetical protein